LFLIKMSIAHGLFSDDEQEASIGGHYQNDDSPMVGND